MTSYLRRATRKLAGTFGRKHSAQPAGTFRRDTSFVVEFTPVEHDGATYLVPAYARERAAAKALLGGTLYEPDTHDLVRALFAAHHGSMIHAGAFYGDMLPSFSRAVTGTVYSFEPVLENYLLANLCIQDNNLENVRLFNAALGAEVAGLRISTRGKDGAHAGGGSRIKQTGAICSALAIDTFDYDRLVLIQLDVEGFQLHALRGATRTIARHRPIVAVEDRQDTCRPFLEERDYRRLVDIPGLNVWAPAESAAYRADLEAFAAATERARWLG